MRARGLSLVAGLAGPLVGLAAGSLLGGCGADPVHDAQVEALGGEVQGVPVGQFHRAGQPCTVCHGGQGPAKTVFALAGTIFSGKNVTVGVDQATVAFTDDFGSHPTPGLTNCVGNFFLTPADLLGPIDFPIEVVVGGLNVPPESMPGHIGRATSCAECHQLQASLDSAGPVYITYPAPTVNPDCPVSPVLATGE